MDRRLGLAAVLIGCGCAAPRGSIQVILDRHAQAVARLPEEERNQLLPYGEAVTKEAASALLPEEVLTLETARSIAVRANPDVHAAQARLETAAARVAEARSRYYPAVLFTHNTARTFQTPANRNRLSTFLQPAPSVPSDIQGDSLAITAILAALRRPLFGAGEVQGDTNPFTENSTAFTMTWTLFDGFVREAQILSAKYVHQASRDSLLDVQRLIIRAVDTAYYQVQFAAEQLRIATADGAFSEEQYRETQKLKAAGRATAADVDNFRVRVLAAQANVTAAERLTESGRVVLAELMGLEETELPASLALSGLGEERPEELVSVEAQAWIETGLSQRPDIAQMEQLLRSAEENVRVARGFYSPSVTASGSWGFDRSTTLAYEDDDQSSAAAIEFRWDVFTGGAREARVRGAESQRAEAAAQLNRQRLTVQSQVQRAVIDLNNAQTQIRLNRETVATALENRRIVQIGYLAGKETLNRLNETQRDYIDADVELTLARIRLRQAWSDLRAAAAVHEGG